MTLIDKETIRTEIKRQIRNETTNASYLELGRIQGNNTLAEHLLAFLDTLPEQPKLKPKAIVIRPAVNLQKELMEVSAEVKDAVMLLLKEGWSLKAPDSEREFDQRAVCAGFSSIPPSYKLDVKKDWHEENASHGAFALTQNEIDFYYKKEQPVECLVDSGKTLEQPASEELENFNAAFDKYMKEHWTHGTQIKEVARHFAEWGAKHIKK